MVVLMLESLISMKSLNWLFIESKKKRFLYVSKFLLNISRNAHIYCDAKTSFLIIIIQIYLLSKIHQKYVSVLQIQEVNFKNK